MHTSSAESVRRGARGAAASDRHRLGVILFLVAAFGSFLLSIGLWFTDNRDEGVFVGLWVPSILSAGAVATLLVIAGMILITPRGEVEMEREAPSSQGAELSRAGVGDASPPASASARAWRTGR